VRIEEEEPIDLATPSGPMRTYVVRPSAAGRYPAIVFFSEIFQRTAPIQRLAAILAGHGFVVAVPEIFHELESAGTVLAYDADGSARGNHHKTAKTCAAYDADARAVITHLANHPRSSGRIGAAGVCIGGHLAFRAAFAKEVLSAACVYATDIHKGTLGLGGDDSLARASSIEGELLMIWGRQDPHIPDEGRALVHRRLSEAGRRFSWHEFNAEHAFLRDEGPRYDPELALTCHRLMVDLFRRTLAI
jgi:carboxymethylenebutenolidase